MRPKRLFSIQSSELLNKRWVFDGPATTTPEAPAPAALEQNLEGLTDATLILRANETRRTLEDKIKIATDIVRRLTGYKQGDEAKEALIIAPLRSLLTAIEADNATREQGAQLRSQARENTESLAQKALLFMPSIGTAVAAFSELRQSVNSVDLSTMASGGWERITRSFSNLLYYIKDFLPPSIREYLKDYIPGEAPTRTPGTPTPPAPREQAPPAPQPAPIVLPSEQLDVTSRSLSDAVIVDKPEVERSGLITFTVPVGRLTQELQVNIDGSVITRGTETITNDALVLPKFLREHSAKLSILMNPTHLNVTDPKEKVDLLKALITHQKKENGSSRSPVDIINLIERKWDRFRADPNKSLLTVPSLLASLKQPSVDQMNPIVADFKDFPESNELSSLIETKRRLAADITRIKDDLKRNMTPGDPKTAEVESELQASILTMDQKQNPGECYDVVIEIISRYLSQLENVLADKFGAKKEDIRTYLRTIKQNLEERKGGGTAALPAPPATLAPAPQPAPQQTPPAPPVASPERVQVSPEVSALQNELIGRAQQNMTEMLGLARAGSGEITAATERLINLIRTKRTLRECYDAVLQGIAAIDATLRQPMLLVGTKGVAAFGDNLSAVNSRIREMEAEFTRRRDALPS